MFNLVLFSLYFWLCCVSQFILHAIPLVWVTIMVWVTQRSPWLPSCHVLYKVGAEAEERVERLLCSRWGVRWGCENNSGLTVFSVRQELRTINQDCLTLNIKKLWWSETPVAFYPSIRSKVSHELTPSICRNSPLLRWIKTQPSIL
jgi:hypothetical protein